VEGHSALHGTWTTRNAVLAGDEGAGWNFLHAVTTYAGDLGGVGHAGASNVIARDGTRHSYAVETVSVTGALTGTFVDFGPVDLLPGQDNEMVATLYPVMGTGDFFGMDGTFSLTIRETGDEFGGDWTLDLHLQ
jgi:hypothetical protein